MFWLVDIFKFIFAICIVALHSWFLGQFCDWLYPTVYYTAVPYFFVASGFFFGKKYYAQGFSREIFAKFRKRLFTKLCVFEPLSQIQVIILLILAGTAGPLILEKTAQQIIFYPLGAMWYIQALLVAGFLLLPFIRYKMERLIIPIGIILYLFALICGRYFFVIEGFSVVKDFVEKYLTLCISPKNGIFIGFPYMGLGVIAAKFWNPNLKQFRFRRIDLLLIVSSLIFFSELLILHYLPNLIQDSQYYLTQPLFVFSVFLFSAKYYDPLSSTSKHNTLIFRNLSIGIYLLHAPVQYAFVLFQKVTGVNLKLFGNPYSLFVLTLSVTLLICYPIYKKKVKYLYVWLT